MHCIQGTQGIQTLAFFKFRLRMPSASSPGLSRVVSPNRTQMCCCSRWGGGAGLAGGGGAGCNRLMTQ